MVAQRAPETLVQPDAILPEGWLTTVDDSGQGNRILHECPIVAGLGTTLTVSEEGEAASGNAPRLLGHELVGLATRTERHSPHPGLHRPPEFDLRRAGAHGLS